jgi:hypothetical protein
MLNITSPTEHLAVDEVIVIMGRVIFIQYISKKHKRFEIKIYTMCDSLGYTYNMAVYLCRQETFDSYDSYPSNCDTTDED